MALLKKEHGIEVKSASSTIEEVVAREFVAKQARQRGVKVPSSASFADTPGGRARRRRRRADAPRAGQARRAGHAGAPSGEDGKAGSPARRCAGGFPELESTRRPSPTSNRRQPPAAQPEPIAPAALVERTASRGAGSRYSGAPRRPRPTAPRRGADRGACRSAEEPAAARAASAAAAVRSVPPPTGRVVPPTLRLRVEDPRTGQAPPAPPRRPMLVRPPQPTTPPPGGNGKSRAALPAHVPGPPVAGRAGPRPSRSSAAPAAADGRSASAARRSRSGRRSRRVRRCLAIGRRRRAPPVRATSGQRREHPRPQARHARAVGAAAGHPHDHAGRGHDRVGSRDEAGREGEGRPEEADGQAADDDDQQHARHGHGLDDRARVRRRRQDAELRRGAAAGRVGGRRIRRT